MVRSYVKESTLERNTIMTDDVKQPLVSEAPASPATPQGSVDISSTETPAPAADPVATPPAKAEETTVSFEEHENLKKALKQERDKFRKLRRGRTNRSGVQTPPPNTQADYVKQLETKVAMGELKSGASKILKNYPDISGSLKRAILRNPRGYIKANTQDVETGLLDIEDYVESEMDLLSEQNDSQTPPKKDVHVAGSNTPDTDTGATPAQLQAILDKPVDEWTLEDRKLLKDYRESHK